MTNNTKQRTGQQNKALHVYCEEMAAKLNDAGFDQKAVIEAFFRVDLPNSMESVKHIFREVGTILYPDTMGDHPSTAKLSTEQLQEVYLAVNRAFAERCKLSMDWPSNEPPMFWGEDHQTERVA